MVIPQLVTPHPADKAEYLESIRWLLVTSTRVSGDPQMEPERPVVKTTAKPTVEEIRNQPIKEYFANIGSKGSKKGVAPTP
jgi:hypothetical protein